MNGFIKKAQVLLNSVRGHLLTRKERIEKTFELAAFLLEAAIHEKTEKEKKRESWLARMMQDPQGRIFLTAMTDQCFRSHFSPRTADQLLYLVKKHGIPRFLNDIDRAKFFIFTFLGSTFPHFFIPQVRKAVLKEMAPVLLPESPQAQAHYFQKNWKEGVTINLNHLGEAILGESEAKRRLSVYLKDLENPHIEYISIKISTIYSQINMADFNHSLERLAERLRLLYRAAKENLFKRSDGQLVQKFVNLDMEEYRDLDLTVALFKKVLSDEEFFNYQAGIVLQAYLPDSLMIQKELTAWAKERVARGGAPIKIRLVKGANLAMERVESSLKGWPQAPFEKKLETDANFRAMAEFGSLKENATAAKIGIGSHNLFDIAYALLLRSENQTENGINFEMLEGMATPLRRVMSKLTGNIVLYCPEAKEKNFESAVAYLIRRLDENSGEENFLRYFFEMKMGNAAWERERKRFEIGCLMIPDIQTERRRKQNRQNLEMAHSPDDPFQNEPDTDLALKENREWTFSIYKEWNGKKIPPIPLVIAADEIETILEPGIDPSRPATPLFHYSLADLPLTERAINAAEEHAEAWGNLPFAERTQILAKAAQGFRGRRRELIGAMIANCGKSFAEADPEVSEAVDFIEFYRKTWENNLGLKDLSWKPKGTVLVTPPWNFPCSIPVGSISAALTAGNCVLFKPAPEAVLVGWEIVKIFWEAGISKNVLQFINCKEDPIGNYLIKHPKISVVALTGATATALKFLKLRPGLDLFAETGSKNSIIVTAMSDRDLAVRDILISAFGHGGQKCSACSLAILEGEVYDDPQFKKQLHDAAQSLIVDSAWNPAAKMTPLIRPPEGSLLRCIHELDEGESWLLQPTQVGNNPHLWTPGIKWGVKENSFTHKTELFGPVLGVMGAKDLDEAIRLANGTPYGLTSGLQSLDEREQKIWQERIEAGNLYINRAITGAIVRRQPFGGCKASSFGRGGKAGGPDYVTQFARATQIGLPEMRGTIPSQLVPLISKISLFRLSHDEEQMWRVSVESYAYWAELLKKPKDFSPVLGEDNYFYLRPLEKITLRLEEKNNTLALLQVIAAALIAKTPLEISTPLPLEELSIIPGLNIRIEEELDFLARKPLRIRLISPPSNTLKQGAADIGATLLAEPVLANGRFELLNYMREIAISADYHRYGYLGVREKK